MGVFVLLPFQYLYLYLSLYLYLNPRQEERNCVKGERICAEAPGDGLTGQGRQPLLNRESQNHHLVQINVSFVCHSLINMAVRSESQIKYISSNIFNPRLCSMVTISNHKSLRYVWSAWSVWFVCDRLGAEAMEASGTEWRSSRSGCYSRWHSVSSPPLHL